MPVVQSALTHATVKMRITEVAIHWNPFAALPPDNASLSPPAFSWVLWLRVKPGIKEAPLKKYCKDKSHFCGLCMTNLIKRAEEHARNALALTSAIPAR